MIAARLAPGMGFVQRLAARAALLAASHAEHGLRRRREDDTRWRRPGLLWPLFATREEGKQ